MLPPKPLLGCVVEKRRTFAARARNSAHAGDVFLCVNILSPGPQRERRGSNPQPARTRPFVLCKARSRRSVWFFGLLLLPTKNPPPRRAPQKSNAVRPFLRRTICVCVPWGVLLCRLGFFGAAFRSLLLSSLQCGWLVLMHKRVCHGVWASTLLIAPTFVYPPACGGQ